MSYKFLPHLLCSSFSQSTHHLDKQLLAVIRVHLTNHFLPCAHFCSCFSLCLPYPQDRDNVFPVLCSQSLLSLHSDLWSAWDIFLYGSRFILFSCRLVLLIKRLFIITLLTIFVIIKWLYIGGLFPESSLPSTGLSILEPNTTPS